MSSAIRRQKYDRYKGEMLKRSERSPQRVGPSSAADLLDCFVKVQPDGGENPQKVLLNELDCGLTTKKQLEGLPASGEKGRW